MQFFLFSILAICIAGSNTQEIAIGTDYLRAHANDSLLSSPSAFNGQIIELPSGGVGVVNSDPSSTTPAGSPATTSPKLNNNDDDSPEHDDDDDKTTTVNYDHDHQSHHQHAATISIDVHNILDIFKEQLHQTEERILAAIHEQKQPSPSLPAIVPKSYRTADRWNE